MKRALHLLLLLFFVNQAQAGPDYDEINSKLKACNMRTSCYHQLVNRYYSVPDLRYFYAKALMNDKKYNQAKIQFNELINHHRSSNHYKQLAKQELVNIEALFDKMDEAQSQDYGNYLSDIDKTFKLPNPSNIKVFIKGDTGNEFLLKNAFAKWDYQLNQLINFYYVNNEQEADIVCYFVKRFDGNKLGATYYDYNNLKRCYRPRIEVSQLDNYGNPHTQNEVLSITLHEIGHALGLQGHSKNINDIMYYSSESYKNGKISRKDVNTIRKLYSK